RRQRQSLGRTRAGRRRHPNLIGGSAVEVTLRRGDDEGHAREQRSDFLEEPTLVLEWIPARLGGVEEEQDSVREMREGRDRLAFHLVPPVHGPVEQPTCVDGSVPFAA